MKKGLWIVFAAMLAVACEEVQPEPEVSERESVFDRFHRAGEIAGFFDPFLLIDRPQYTSVDSARLLQDDELVLLFKKDDQVYVYAHEHMDVEVVNETNMGHPIAITFCPLTRSGLAWNRVVNLDTLLLTASGYLLRENMVPLDTRDSSLFSQMLSEGIDGNQEGRRMDNLPMIETKWSTVKTYFPNAMVFDSEETRIVCGDPNQHGTQSISSSSKKSASASDPHYFGVPGKQGVVLFPYSQFPGEIHAVDAMDLYGSRRMLYLVGSEELRYIAAFRTSYVLNPIEGSFPVIMEDETGTRWNLFGEAVSGPRMGEVLEKPDSYVALDWAWELFYPEITYFDKDNPV